MAALLPLLARRRGAAPFGLPSFTPLALAAARASRVRVEIALRSRWFDSEALWPVELCLTRLSVSGSVRPAPILAQVGER